MQAVNCLLHLQQMTSPDEGNGTLLMHTRGCITSHFHLPQPFLPHYSSPSIHPVSLHYSCLHPIPFLANQINLFSVTPSLIAYLPFPLPPLTPFTPLTWYPRCSTHWFPSSYLIHLPPPVQSKFKGCVFTLVQCFEVLLLLLCLLLLLLLIFFLTFSFRYCLCCCCCSFDFITDCCCMIL